VISASLKASSNWARCFDFPARLPDWPGFHLAASLLRIPSDADQRSEVMAIAIPK